MGGPEGVIIATQAVHIYASLLGVSSDSKSSKIFIGIALARRGAGGLLAMCPAVPSRQHALLHRTLRRVRRKSFRHRPFEESPACSSGVVTACAKNDRALLLPAQQQPPVRVSESRACRLDEGERRGGTNELNEAGVCTHIGS